MSGFAWTDRTVREALRLRLEDAEDDVAYERVSTDSRRSEEGDLYVALVGDRFDGHDFVADALAAGARAAVVSRPVVGDDVGRLYPVDDTLEALGRLARFRRDRLPARVVGITGSSGKTGTKNLTAAALGSTLRVHATRQNLNNQIGVPLTLLEAPADAEAVVVEMGTNEPGEIQILTSIVRPDVGVITTVGESHLERLGSVEGVLEEKLDLVRGLVPGETVAIVGDEPAVLPPSAREVHPHVRVAGFSERADDDLRPSAVEVDHWGYHRFRWKGHSVVLAAPGRHSVTNALLALAVSDELDVPPERATTALARVGPGSMRGEVRRIADLTLLLDCYNANPQSVGAALDLLESHGHAARRVAVLGTMLELGSRSEELHERVLEDALRRDLHAVVAVGAFASAAGEIEAGDAGHGPASREGAGTPELVVERDLRAAYRKLRDLLEGNEVVLLKASRGVTLETLVPLFEEDWGGGEESSAEGEEG